MAKQKQLTSLLTCGHCGNSAPMETVAAFEDTTHYSVAGLPRHAGVVYQLLQCPVCRAVTLRSHSWHDQSGEEEVAYKHLYPSQTKLPLGLPRPIETAFLAATKIRAIDANAYGVLVGRVIEMVCADRNATGKFLSHKLADLAAKGEIPNKLVEVAKSLAALRNVGAHFDLGELTPEEVPILEDLCKAILDYVYTAPFLVRKAQNALAKLKLRPSAIKLPAPPVAA